MLVCIRPRGVYNGDRGCTAFMKNVFRSFRDLAMGRAAPGLEPPAAERVTYLVSKPGSF